MEATTFDERLWRCDGLTQTILLTGKVHEWTAHDLNIDALIAPLGLSGRFAVRGIYHEHKEVDDLYLVLTPEMTALHITRALALEHARLEGEDAWDHWTECLRFNARDRVIELGTGS